ncbi:hypothetical protein BHE90_011648 [Fusarium euwallaceae]|uniref:LITAF domain-containing protein n=1 Tax=Fusarium euwallaceae TaxID=1147111 RepID=A0A430LE10_9HYPO|nr:hypothetical protein BHE90_011648 [Fusarium euwallaceae]
MEKPTPPQNDHHPALEVNQDQPPTYNNRDFSSPLAQPPLTNPGSPPPAHLHNPNDFPPQSQGQPPHGQPPQQNLNSVPLQSLQSQSAPVVCPSCGVRDFTVTTAEAGGFTHAAAALVCFDVHHRCANCGVPLADYHRSGRTEVRCWQK